MSEILKLFSNYTLNVALMCWVSAQVCKTVFHYIRTKKLRLERLAGSGGMPSAHSATVSSLASAVVKTEGLRSANFAIAFMFAFIVMYDASGVRRAAGEQAKILNHLINDLSERKPVYWKKNLKELIGHTPLEVIAGALIGILIVLIVPY